jgi:hypothetical protein
MAAWEGLGGGMARVRIFNRSLNAADYVAKNSAPIGADLYEVDKFGWSSSQVMLSKGAQALLERVIREDRRRIERSEKRSDTPTRAPCNSVKSQRLNGEPANPGSTRRERFQAAEVLRKKWAMTEDQPGTLRSVTVSD